MALSDEVRAGSGRDIALNDRIVAALDPTHVGVKPEILHDWNALMAFKRSLPGVRYRLGHDRLGISPAGEPLMFYAAISTDHGVNRFDPVATDQDTDDAERRTFLAALLQTQGL